jgi:hypothetical protein
MCQVPMVLDTAGPNSLVVGSASDLKFVRFGNLVVIS